MKSIVPIIILTATLAGCTSGEKPQQKLEQIVKTEDIKQNTAPQTQQIRTTPTINQIDFSQVNILDSSFSEQSNTYIAVLLETHQASDLFRLTGAKTIQDQNMYTGIQLVKNGFNAVYSEDTPVHANIDVLVQNFGTLSALRGIDIDLSAVPNASYDELSKQFTGKGIETSLLLALNTGAPFYGTMTPDEGQKFGEYDQHVNAILMYSDHKQALSKNPTIRDAVEKSVAYCIANLEWFYEGRTRSQVQIMLDAKQNAILVIGSGHYELVRDMLKKEQVNYIITKPKAHGTKPERVFESLKHSLYELRRELNASKNSSQ